MPAKRRRKTTRRRRSTTATKRAKKPQLQLHDTTKRQISGTVQICVGIFLLLVAGNRAGVAGELASFLTTTLFGRWGLLFPIFLILSGLLHWFLSPQAQKGRKKEKTLTIKIWLGLGLCFLTFMGLMHIGAPVEDLYPKRNDYAGAVGFLMSMPFVMFASRAVGYTVLLSGFIVGIFVAFEPNIPALVKAFKGSPKRRVRETAVATKAPKAAPATQVEEVEPEEELELPGDLVEEDGDAPELNIVRPDFATKKAGKKVPLKKASEQMSIDTIEMKDTRFEEWTFPSYDLLDSRQSELSINDDELKAQAKLIEEKLEEFGIDVTMRDAHPGPTVTQFTLKPAEGVKLSRIAALKSDLALALAAPSLRIEAPIPGKALVGIEMPNSKRTIVHLREILESPEFVESPSSLTLPLGRDVSGHATLDTLENMPHLLLAGATGSGKSVCMNTFLTALLYQNAPDQLKFILIDPKRVELMPFDGIPHLLTPVITESEKALQALRWAVAEMGRRLHRFSEAGVRNINEYNQSLDSDEDILPRVVVVIDELADLMMRQFRRDTETMVARIAQMARAVGMHLIIATQRPSVDVITGLIKANIPTRLSFRTVSSVDSRTILDTVGAEDLLGRGDMLYLTAETPRPVRIQGIFISTKEIERVINAVKIAGGGQITEEIALENEPAGASEGDGAPTVPYIDLEADDNGGDDLFFDAVQVVQESGKASASLLQRRLSIGYARAAKLLDIMEEKGLIGPSRGAKAREVYIDSSGAPSQDAGVDRYE